MHVWVGTGWNSGLAEARGDLVVDDGNLLVLKDTEVNCPHRIDRGDVAEVLEMCKAGKFDVFEYNAKYSKICRDVDLYNIQPLRPRKGSYVVVHRRLFREASDRVRFNVDFECAGEPVRKQSKTLFDLLKKADLGNYVSLNLVGDEYEAKYCWTIGRSFRKDAAVTLGRLKSLEPKKVRYKTTQCHISGAIQPDDYNDVFYPGDVVPAAL